MEEEVYNTIKFSHLYDKLLGMSTSPRLIQVLKIHYDDLSKWMVDYDSKIYESNEHYPIPKGYLILLIFQSDKNMIFTTLRRYTIEKYAYYKKREGLLFNREFEQTNKLKQKGE